MSKATIIEASSTMIEIEIDMEWMSIGRDRMYRYAESLASVFTLGGVYDAVGQRQTETGTVVVRLTKAPR